MKKPRSRTRGTLVPWGVVGVLCLVQFVDVLGVTEVLSAAPRMLASVSAPTSAASAVLTSYAMCFGGLLMLGARLGDRFGHRAVLLGGIGLFALGSLCTAWAHSVTGLIVGRCLQGAAAAVSVPTALRLLIAATPRSQARRAGMSAWSAAGAAAGASGFVLGGTVTQLIGWRAMFWINVPLAGLMAAAVLRLITERAPDRRPRLDLLGGLLFSAGVAGVVLGASLLQPPSRVASGIAVVAAGIVLLTAVARAERRAREPIIPVAALRYRTLRSGALAAFLNTATTSSAMAITTLALQRSEHLSPAATGLRLVPVSLGAVAGAGVAPAVLRRLTPGFTVGLGLGLIGSADAGLTALVHSGWWLAIAVFAAGFGLGVSSVAANALATEVAEPLQAQAAGAINTTAQLGTALGVAALLLITAASVGSGVPLAGSGLGWIAAAVFALAGAAGFCMRGATAGHARNRRTVAGAQAE